MIKDFPEESTLEYIHGEKGYAILVRRELVAEIPYQSYKDLSYRFAHFLWHEFGHFYAINSETEDFHHYTDPGLADDSGVITISSERKKQEGYWLWNEFIAECIANHVSFTHRSSTKYYHPEKIDWYPDFWDPITGRLLDFLEGAFSYYPYTVDEYSLAHYFAYLLTDDLCCLYVDAARSLKLKIWDNGAGTVRQIVPEDGFEPSCITDMSGEFHGPLWKLHGILSRQLKKERFWEIDADTLETIGDSIADLIVLKVKMLSGIGNQG